MRVRVAGMATWLLAYLLSACTLQADSLPLLWSADYEGRPRYVLYGTVHVAARPFRIPPAVADALERCPRLIVEALPPDAAERERLQQLAQATNENAVGRLESAMSEQVAHAAQRLGVDVELLRHKKLWAAWLTLAGAAATAAGYTPANGVDLQLLRVAKGKGLAVEPLETVVDQLAMLDAIPVQMQREMLRDWLLGWEKGETSRNLRLIEEAWRRGDPRDLLAAHRQTQLSPAFAAVESMLLRKRNERWAVHFSNAAARGSCAVVAVGAVHLVGPYNLQGAMAARGFELRPYSPHGGT